MNRKIMISTLALAATLLGAGAFAVAKGSESSGNDALADLANARISLSQAVDAAQSHAGGKATKAELESEHGTLVFEVEVVTADSKVLDVRVDAVDGKVLSSKADKDDRDKKKDDDD